VLAAATAIGAALVAMTVGCGGSDAPVATDPPGSLAPVTTVPAALTAGSLATAMAGDAPVPLRLEVVAEYPHDTQTFTQGLEYASDDEVLVSSGLYGDSWVGVVDPATGETKRRVAVDGDWFAEGLTLVDTEAGQELVLLTWRERTASFRDPVTLAERRRVGYEGEGWGVCDLGDGTVAMSDGTDTLAIRSVDDFAVRRTVAVTADRQPVPWLNELECRGGLVWANVWRTGRIVAIDPRDGRVVGDLDATELVGPNRAAGGDVLNGIAAVPDAPDEFLLTGKRWPTTYRVRVGVD